MSKVSGAHTSTLTHLHVYWGLPITAGWVRGAFLILLCYQSCSCWGPVSSCHTAHVHVHLMLFCSLQPQDGSPMTSTSAPSSSNIRDIGIRNLYMRRRWLPIAMIWSRLTIPQDLAPNQEVKKCAKMGNEAEYTACNLERLYTLLVKCSDCIWIAITWFFGGFEALQKQRRWFTGSFAETTQAVQGALPAGRCPPLVSIFSFGGDDMSALIRSLRREETRASNKLIPGVFFCLKFWTTLQSGSSTWLFPEHCLESMRGDVTWDRRELNDARSATTSP